MVSSKLRRYVVAVNTSAGDDAAARFCSSAIRRIGRRPRMRFSHRNRHRAAAEGTELRAARGAFAGQSLSIERPASRRSCLARVGAKGFSPTPEFPRSPKRKRFSVRWRHEPIERADDVRAWDSGRIEILQCNKLPLHRRSCCHLARLCPIHAAWASASSMRFQIWLGISMLSRCGRDMKEI